MTKRKALYSFGCSFFLLTLLWESPLWDVNFDMPRRSPARHSKIIGVPAMARLLGDFNILNRSLLENPPFMDDCSILAPPLIVLGCTIFPFCWCKNQLLSAFWRTDPNFTGHIHYRPPKWTHNSMGYAMDKEFFLSIPPPSVFMTEDPNVGLISPPCLVMVPQLLWFEYHPN